jgi:hypothetical protein
MGVAVIQAKRIHGFWRVSGGRGNKPDFPLAVRQNFDDIVVPLFPFARISGKTALS